MIPDYCFIRQSSSPSVNAWFGPAGTNSPLHFDPKHNLFCQVPFHLFLYHLFSGCWQEILEALPPQIYTKSIST